MRNESDWVEFQRWCRKGFIFLGLSFLFMIVLTSIPVVRGTACQACYGVGAFFLLVGYVFMGRAVLSLKIGPTKPADEGRDTSHRSEG